MGGDLTAKGTVNLGTDCFDDIFLNGETQFGCKVTIGDPNSPCTTGNFLVYSPSYFYCPVEISNTLTVLGDFVTDLGGDLFVAGATQLNGTLTVANNQATFLGGTLTVRDGMATVLGGTLQVKGQTQLDDTLTVDGATLINNTFTVADGFKTTLGGDLQVKLNTLLNGTLTVSDTKSSTLGGTLLVKEKTTLFATKNCAADALLVNGKSVFECDVAINANLDINGDLTTDGDMDLSGDVILGTDCNNTLLVKSTTTINCATEILNTLDVTGDFVTTLGGKLHVVGNTALGTTNASERLEVNGNVGIARTVGGYYFLTGINGTRRAGVASNASDDLNLKSGNQVTALTVKGSNQYVGIGTTDPKKLLEISGAEPRERITDTSNTQDAAKTYLEFFGNNGRGSLIFTSGKNLNFQNDRPGGHIRWMTEGSDEKMRLTNTGRLGISNQTPSSLLHIGDHTSGVARDDAYITFGKRSNSTTENNQPFIGQPGYAAGKADLGLGTWSDNAAIRFYTGTAQPFSSSQERVTILANGNLGVGTTNPLVKLEVSGQLAVNRPLDFWSTTSTYVDVSNNGSLATQGSHAVHLTSNGYRVANSKWKSLGANGNTGAAQITLDPTGIIRFGTEANKADGSNDTVTHRMTLTADGKLGIGNTNPSVALHVTGQARSSTSTLKTHNAKTLVTLDYILSTGGSGTGQFGYWTRSGTTLSMVNNTDTASLGGVLNLAGNFNINTNKFKVVAASGNTTVAGTLGSRVQPH